MRRYNFKKFQDSCGNQKNSKDAALYIPKNLNKKPDRIIDGNALMKVNTATLTFQLRPP